MQPTIFNTLDCRDWDHPFSPDLQLRSIHALEQGQVLMLPQLSFLLFTDEYKFLSPDYIDHKNKNMSYTPAADVLRGGHYVGKEYEEIKAMLKRFANQTETFIRQLFPQYSSSLKIGRTSFRPVEIAGRKTSYRKDDTRLHVDAFPATPNQGQRILRVFSNINPNGQDRVWRVGEPFLNVAERFLPRIKKAWPGKSALLKMFKLTKSFRTEYDHIMLQIHNRMKADLHYQKTVPQREIRFAPGNTWIVQTDHVSHAAMSGQYLLEQTFYLPVTAMMNPDLSPLSVLEKLSGKALV